MVLKQVHIDHLLIFISTQRLSSRGSTVSRRRQRGREGDGKERGLSISSEKDWRRNTMNGLQGRREGQAIFFLFQTGMRIRGEEIQQFEMSKPEAR